MVPISTKCLSISTPTYINQTTHTHTSTAALHNPPLLRRHSEGGFGRGASRHAQVRLVQAGVELLLHLGELRGELTQGIKHILINKEKEREKEREEEREEERERRERRRREENVGGC